MSAVECAVRAANILGECTLWDDRAGLLRWVDTRAPALYGLDPASGAFRSLALPEAIGSFALRERGGLLAALASGFHFLDPGSGALARIVDPEADLPENRFNDGRCDRRGRFIAGTMSDARREPLGALYRLDADGACTRLRGDIVVPNSLAFSPDGGVMYFADTYRRRILAYDYDQDSGVIGNERVFVDAGTHPGKPDGSCVDADGCLWNAEYGGWRVVRYTPAGTIDRVIDMPVANPTCCCFGGAALDTLYVSSATQRLTRAELAAQPLAGSLLAVRPGVRGLPEARFGG